jgi:hypothetical protein
MGDPSAARKDRFHLRSKEGFQGQTDEMFAILRRYNPTHARRLGELTFRASVQFCPLQASDFLAYGVRRNASDRFAHKSGPGRKSLKLLIRNKDVIVGYADEDYLRAHLEVRAKQLGLLP